ncbi:hypothetical protein [Patulibacter defluvii]|uniref:hypothetical protein n=1 Tax=Patulibacter defluvii TaxID=3095358 RepID=UPI002A74BCD2|nr:hypothetical protein [Patulibacter sp. DM4]
MLSLSRGRPAAPFAAALAVAALALVPSLASAAPPRGQDALTADPMARGPYPVQRVSYDVGDLRLATRPGITPDATLVPLRGSVTFPQGKVDPSRLVVYLHGNHGTCREYKSAPIAPPKGAPAGTPSTDPCPDWLKINSFAGYDYLSDNLASHGYVVVSPEANLASLTSAGLLAGDGTGSSVRSQILQATLEAVRDWNDGGAVMNTAQAVDVTKPPSRTSLKGKVDLDAGIGLMGHSRGGAGVVDFLTFNRNNVRGRQWLIDATLALEPTTYTDHKTPEGTNFATLLGGCDGDMTTLEGANFFGLAKYRPANAKTADLQFYVEGANHNFYNTIWAADGDDADGTCGGWSGFADDQHPEVRLSEPDQQKTGIALMNAFMRRYVGDETAMEPLMTGETTLPASACPTGDSAKAVDCRDLVRSSYIGPDAQRLDLIRPDGADPTGTTATGGAITASGLKRYQLCDPENSKPNACPQADTTPSWGDQYTIGWDGPASLTAQLAPGGAAADLTGTRALQLRTALDEGAAENPRGQAQDYAVTLTDATGASATTKISDWSASLRAPFKPHTVLNGVWIPLSAFAGVDPSRVVSLRFDFGGEGLPAKGLIQLSDVSFLRRAPTAVQPSIPAPDGPPSALGTTLATTAVSSGKDCRDVAGPQVRNVSLKRGKRRILVVRGRSSDLTNCKGQHAAAVRGTMVAIRQPVLGKKSKGQCRYLDARGRWTSAVPCRASRVRYVKGTAKWSLRVRLPKSGLPSPGVTRRTVTVIVRSYDRNGNLGKAVQRTLRYP